MKPQTTQSQNYADRQRCQALSSLTVALRTIWRRPTGNLGMHVLVQPRQMWVLCRQCLSECEELPY
jgi:hypothetical protein